MKQQFMLVVTGLLLSLVSQAYGCGGNFTASVISQVLTSPNYPRDHGNNLNCVWNIEAPNHRNIMLVITDLDTEPCCDYLDIIDGSSNIGRYKGRSTSSIPIISSNTRLRLIFRTDSSVANSGFRVTFIQALNCGNPVTASEQDHYMSTPFFPEPHPLNVDCFWTITASDNSEKVQFEITDGSIDECCDYIEIFDVSRKLARIKGDLSNTKKYSSSKEQLNIYYHSESTNPRNGFRAKYKQYECGGTFRLDSNEIKTIASPNYPNGTDHNLDCDYIFQAEQGYQVEIDLEIHTEKCCDYVEVFEGSRVLGRINGDVLKSTTVSTGRTLRILFHTDGSVNSKGFIAKYRQILPRCGTYYQATNTPQDLVSPGYPNTYPNNYQCDWSITAVGNKNIVLTIDDLVTESCCDYVEIFDGLTSMGRYKGQLGAPVSIVTKTTSMRIRLFTDDTTQKKGFKASFKLAENCGSARVAVRSPTSIKTPGYPNDHADNLDCMWTLQSGDNTQVELNITAGETETGHDYLQVLDDLHPIARLEGVLTPKTYISTGKILRVFFHSDEGATRDGFTGFFRQVCRFYYNVTADQLYLTSPNYPNYSHHNFDCTYHLVAPPNQRIQLRIVDVKTESCCDYVRVSDGDIVLNTYRGKDVVLPQTLVSSGTQMSVFYHTDSSVGSKGFQFTYGLAPA